jgi:curli biogenesis system outer membrane secretion channel CsgG
MVAFALAVAPAAWGQTAGGDVARRPALVVAAFETDRTAWMPPPRLGETLAEMLTAALASAGCIRIIDPLWLSGSSGADRAPAPETLFAQATRAGIDYIVLGSVTRLSIERQSSSRAALLPKPIAVGMIRTQATETVIGLTIRVVNARTGEVVAVSTTEGGSKQQHRSGGGLAVVAKLPLMGGSRSSAAGHQDRLLDEALEIAIAKTAEEIATAIPAVVGAEEQHDEPEPE